MRSIAKKSRSVKGQKGTKKPPRFTIKKDSLGRRYAIDKRTGKRATLFKAEKERESRKKVTAAFRGIIDKKRSRGAKKGWETRRHNERSKAVKKGWETRRKKAVIEPIVKRIPIYEKKPTERPPFLAEIEYPFIPEGMRMHTVGGIADRAKRYPKVESAAQLAFVRLELEGITRHNELAQGLEPTVKPTPHFDKLYGEGHGAHVRNEYYAHARDLEDIDQIIEYLEQNEDNEYTSRELYTLYFSPEVA